MTHHYDSSRSDLPLPLSYPRYSFFFFLLFFAGVVKSRLEAINGGLPLEAALCYESYTDVRNPNDS